MGNFFEDKNSLNLQQGAISNKTDRERKLLSKARVEKVFLDYEDSQDKSYKIPPGVIEALDLNGSKTLQAYPMDEGITTLPVVGEVVEIIRISGKPFYRRLTIFGPSINAFLNITKDTGLNNLNEDPTTAEENTQDRYAINLGAGSKPVPNVSTNDYKNLAVQTNSGAPSQNLLNNNFKFQPIQRLKLYDGDTIIQSRFGQSIRLSGYNNQFKEPHPTIIIRNGLPQTDPNIKLDESTEEDINYDAGTIAFTAGKYQSNFLPGVIDANGISNFELKVWENSINYALESYPRKLDGNQILITSDRLILSSKVNETMIFSKGVMSLISDSYLTIDSNKGISVVNQKNDIQFIANDQETKFFVGNSGKIFLGINTNSPSYAVVNGKELVDLIGELIEEMVNLTLGGILTPAGPTTGITPDKQAKFKAIAGKLPGLLSKKVFIGM